MSLQSQRLRCECKGQSINQSINDVAALAILKKSVSQLQDQTRKFRVADDDATPVKHRCVWRAQVGVTMSRGCGRRKRVLSFVVDRKNFVTLRLDRRQENSGKDDAISAEKLQPGIDRGDAWQAATRLAIC